LGFGQIVPAGIWMLGSMALDESTDWTLKEILVPSEHRFTGKGRISFNVEKKFSALLIPATYKEGFG